MPDGIIPEKCKECSKCHGLEKRIHTIEQLEPIPAECFIAELNLEDDDKREITNHRREGAHIALIDSILTTELETLQTTVAPLDMPHYLFNQRPWFKRTDELYRVVNRKDPSQDELDAAYAPNNPRYRVAYALLFPELVSIRPEATEPDVTKFAKFLLKADEIADLNIKKFGFMGACHLFRIQLAAAQRQGVPYRPSYTRSIFRPESILTL